MKKFSKIIEGKLNGDELLSKLGISDDDLHEVFIDMIDLGYNMTYEGVYISPSTGYPHRSSSSLKEFYPGLEIDLHRKTSDSSGETLKKFDDVRKWNGGVYYEDDILIIESIANVVHRLKSMLESKAGVYYSIRNLNEISIRIISNLSQSDLPIDYEVVKSYINNLHCEPRHGNTYSVLDGTRIDYYRLNIIWSSDTQFVSEIRNIEGQGSNVNINNPEEPIDFIVKDILDKGKGDNKYQLDSIFNTYVKKIYKRANSFNKLELVKLDNSRHGGPAYAIIDKESKSRLIEIKSAYEDFANDVNIILQKGGLFQKNKVAKINLYYIEIAIEIVG